VVILLSLSNNLNFPQFKVLETSPDFQEVQDLIFRYETLDTNLKELMKARQENDFKYKMKLKELNLFKEVGFILFLLIKLMI
jgi:hypothetical protein